MRKQDPLVFWTALGVLLSIVGSSAWGVSYVSGLSTTTGHHEKTISEHEQRIRILESYATDIAVIRTEIKGLREDLNKGDGK